MPDVTEELRHGDNREPVSFASKRLTLNVRWSGTVIPTDLTHDIVRALEKVAREAQFLSVEASSPDMNGCVVITWMPEDIFDRPPPDPTVDLLKHVANQPFNPDAPVEFSGEDEDICSLCNQPIDGPPGSVHKECADLEAAGGPETHSIDELPQV